MPQSTVQPPRRVAQLVTRAVEACGLKQLASPQCSRCLAGRDSAPSYARSHTIRQLLWQPPEWDLLARGNSQAIV